MEKSTEIKELAAALAKAQGEMKAAEMTATNPFLHNKYADLGAVIQASKSTMAKYGLSVAQPVSGNGEIVTVTTLLMHESGQWIEETISLPLGEEKGKSRAQVAGSIVTYLRRYSLASMLGIYADEDTDGSQEKANGKQPARTPEPQPKNGNGKPADEPEPKMELATAEAVTNSKGERYGDLDNEALSSMTIGIGKALNKKGLTQAEVDAYQLKMDAIATILYHRAHEAQPA